MPVRPRPHATERKKSFASRIINLFDGQVATME